MNLKKNLFRPNVKAISGQSGKIEPSDFIKNLHLTNQKWPKGYRLLSECHVAAKGLALISKSVISMCYVSKCLPLKAK